MPVLWRWIFILEDEEKEMRATTSEDPTRWFESGFWFEYELLFLVIFSKNGIVSRQKYALLRSLVVKEKQIQSKWEN